MAVTYRYSEGNYIDHIPNADVAAGDVIDLGDLVGIAERDIPADSKGALAIEGIFKVAKKTSDGAWTLGAPVYYDAGTESFSTDGAYSEAAAGVAVPGGDLAAMAGDTDEYGYIKLTPGIARS